MPAVERPGELRPAQVNSALLKGPPVTLRRLAVRANRPGDDEAKAQA